MTFRYAVSGIILFLLSLSGFKTYAQELYKAPPDGIETRWVSPENPGGAKGQGGIANKGAKGNAFFIIAPGEKKIIFDVKGAGIIKRIWLSGSIAKNVEQKRSVRLDMFWDNAAKPAVSAPVGDFFGLGLGLRASYESSLFSSPEANSYVCAVPMPYRTAARIELTNESPSYVLLWYDINFLKLQEQEDNALYFHAFWNRNPKTELGKDYEILPKVNGIGRYLGANIGVIGNPIYKGTWFGEGEVKVYLDGDKNLPTLVGTGTEDYIGTGWGQKQFHQQHSGSLLADTKNDLYAFYRYHTIDPVYFHKDCRVTIQQIGSAPIEGIKKLLAKKPQIKIVWRLEGNGAADITNIQGKAPEQVLYLDINQNFDTTKINFSESGFANFYRSDDVSATAYFYLDKPASELPILPSLELRMRNMKPNVFDKTKQ